MRIKILSDGRVLEGTAEQIAQQTQYLAFGQEDHSLGAYVDWLEAQVERMESISLDVHGDTGPEKAKSLVQATPESGVGGEDLTIAAGYGLRAGHQVFGRPHLPSRATLPRNYPGLRSVVPGEGR